MIYSSPCVYSFGNRPKTTSQNFINTSNKLGPGQYDFSSKKLNKKGDKTFSFGKDEKLKPIKSTTPGPGEYESDFSTFGKNVPGYSMGKSNRTSVFDKSKNNRDHQLGPGYYTTEPSTGKGKKGYSMNGSERVMHSINKVPGPGEYEPANYFGKTGYKKGIPQHDKRETFQIKNENIPGPGAYNTKSDFDPKKKNGISIRGKPVYSNSNGVPGPGEYSISETHVKGKKGGPQFSVGNEKRQFFGIEDNKNNLGPGMYDAKDPKEKTKGYAFSKEKKFSGPISTTPGPGYYKIPCGMVHVPMYTEEKFDPEFKYV